MRQLNPAAAIVPRNQERRRSQRVKVDLTGRYMLADRREFTCRTLDMSPGGAALIAPALPRPGEPVVAYIDHIGRLEGHCVRLFENGFAMTVQGTIRRRDKLADQLTWFANRNSLGLPEDRRHERFTLRNPRSTLTLPGGEVVPARVLDVSLSGAAVQTRDKPPVGTPVVLGKTPGRVVRHIEQGFAIEFTRVQTTDALEQNISVNEM
ncbi:MAG: PilZ domain-containing protein [Xanthobacteraceae bacterium]|nr:PilZ domain-containing protein [Xanthobacteraceae bacterium]QYK43965.1 MAG: PilZ domain-containing protein [Xanthobacteraceae bacterium]